MKSSGRAPRDLSFEAKDSWRQLVDDFGIDDHAGLVILRTGLEAFDRMRDCQARIAKDGPVMLDRFGQPKPHPLLAVERDSRAQFLAALKQLNLDIEPLRDRPGRPPGR